MLAGILSALCLWFAWSAYQRCRKIHRGAGEASGEGEDPLEQRLAERELNLELNLASRTVQALGRAALFGGTGLAIWFVATGTLRSDPRQVYQAFAFGLVGWGGCRELQRRIGSLADAWRTTTNDRRRRRQGVDQPKRTGVA
ncbi:MAG: hypothetical protein EOO73_25975 [Myxococcales bacterium]|nr:MAG: hypothetical protein EOO73_25975 [Myxococcales bacterium]